MIDIPTVVLWNGVALALIGALFLLYWAWQTRAADQLWWCLPFLFGVLAAITVVTPPSLPVLTGKGGTVLCMMLAYGTLWQASRAFYRRRSVLWQVLAVVAAWVVASITLQYAGGPAYADILLRGVIIALFNILAAREFWRNRAKEELPSRKAIVAILGANALFQAFSHLFAPLLPAPLGLGDTTIWAVVTYNLVVLFIALSVTMLVISLSREKEAEEYLQLAIHDPLTGLLNRLTFDEHMAEKEGDERLPFALIVIDIDYFKRINDDYGHHVGDAVIVQAARTIERGVRQSDKVYRFGGEEFVCMLPGVGLETAQRVAERIRKSFDETLTLVPEGEVHATISVGVAACTNGERSPSTVLNDADAALYMAKRRGRNRVEVATASFMPA
ncbi:GGDEF domain-containing protein [Xanthobacter sp. TB0139]|uniref:GGDEF domain-containing protein n=1 Tax=Xanthobacter sp. TB0139 TaxID=3459178 RepID=UPI0040395E22